MEDFSEDEPDSGGPKSPGARDSLAYSGTMQETLEGAGGTSVNFGFNSKNSFMFQNMEKTEPRPKIDSDKMSTVGRDPKNLLSNSEVRQLQDLTSSGVDSSMVNFNLTNGTMPSNIMRPQPDLVQEALSQSEIASNSWV